MNLQLLLTTKLKFIISLILTVVLSFSLITPVYARTAEEVQKDINAKNAQLKELQKNLDNAQKQLNSYTTQKNSSSSEIAKLDAQIKEMQAQIDLNNLKLQEVEQNKELKELEKEDREKQQDEYIYTSYLSWKTTNIVGVFFSNEDFVKNATYNDALSDNEK